MSDFYDEIMNNEMPKSEQNKPEPEEPIEASAVNEEPVQQPEPNEEPIQQTDSYEEPVQHTESYEEPAQETEPSESSYEWNAEDKTESGEYHYSYVNGNNSSASHNPNNYDSYRSQPTGSQGYGYQQPRQTTANPLRLSVAAERLQQLFLRAELRHATATAAAAQASGCQGSQAP